jgi:short-subunit dehydrogenase
VRGAADELGRAVLEALGPVDILVNNAGGGVGGRQMAVGDRDEGREVFELNVWSPVVLVQRLVPGMRQRRLGAVVNVTSMAQVMTWPFMGHYTASKAALASLTETLRLELRGSGVQVLQVIPGPVGTPIYGESQLVPGLMKAMGAIRPGDPEVLARRVIRALQRDRARMVYPGMLRLAYELPVLVRATVGVQVDRSADEIDPDDERVLRSGSHGDELARAAREAWDRGDRDLTELRSLAHFQQS